jgi:hypothetical protein
MRTEIDFSPDCDITDEEAIAISSVLEKLAIPYFYIWDKNYWTDEEKDKEWFVDRLKDGVDFIDYYPYYKK